MVTYAVAPDDQAVAFQANAAHTGAVSGAGVAPPLTQAWSVPGSDSNVSYPLIVNGVVYVTRAGIEGYGLEARSQATGDLLWSKSSPALLPGAAYDRGRVFVISENGQLTAYEADTGALAWTVDLPLQSYFTSAPTAKDGRVYVSGGGSGGTLYAVRGSNGSLAWSAPVYHGEYSTPAVTDDSAYVTSGCHQDHAFTLAGTPRWTFAGTCTGWSGTTPVVANGRVWSRAYNGNPTPILLDTSTGTPAGAFVAATLPAVTPTASYLVNDTTLTAMGPTGGGPAAWTFTGAKAIPGPPLAVDGVVFTGDIDGLLSAVQGGSSMWSSQVGTGFRYGDYSIKIGMAAANGTLVAPSGPTLAAFRPSATVGAAPVNTTAPSISGAQRASQRLVAGVGVWSGLPTSYGYQWQRCDGAGANCTNVPSATGQVYTPAADDAGRRFRVTVTARNAADSASASALSGVLDAALAPPQNTSLPEFSGFPYIEETLTATPGGWAGAPATYTYQWYRCDGDVCTDIQYAVAKTYTPSAYDVGRYVGVDVTASNDAGSSTVSSLADYIYGYLPSIDERPRISGTPRVGATLSTSAGSWDGAPTSFTFEWRICNGPGYDCVVARAASTSTEYTVQPTDVDGYLMTVVVAANEGGEGPPAASVAVGPVLPALNNGSRPARPTTTGRPLYAGPQIAPPLPPADAPLKLDLDTSQMPKRLKLKNVCPVDKRGRARAGAFSGTYELAAAAASTQVKLSAELPAAKGKPKTALPLAARTTKRVDPFSEDIEIPIDRKRCALLRRATTRSGKATLVLSLSLAPEDAGVVAESRTLRIALRR